MRIKKWNDYLHSCMCTTTVMGRNQSKPILFETDTVELEGTRIPHGSMGRMSETEKHETDLILFSSESARIVIATATGRLERAR